MLESKSFTVTILIFVSIRVTEEGLVIRPTRAFADVLSLGRREHLMTQSSMLQVMPGQLPGQLPVLPGQLPGSIQQRRPMVVRQKVGIGQHLPRLPRGYAGRYRPQQQRPYQPRNVFRQNNPDLTTSTTGPILRQLRVENTTTTSPTTAAPNETDSQNQQNPQNLPREPENYVSRLYEGPSTRSTSPLYAPGQEPQHGYTDKVLQEKCKNAQCNPVAWQDVEELT